TCALPILSKFVHMLNGLREFAAGREDADGAPIAPDGDAPDGVAPSVGDVVEAVLDRTGYRAELEASSDPQDGARLDNLNELVSVAHEFSVDAANAAAADAEPAPDADAAHEAGDAGGPDEQDGLPEPGSLAAFLERVSLVADADSIPGTDDGVVTLMTLHTAKGLEFPVAFLTGWE